MARLLSGVLACVLLPLGVVFTLIGLTADEGGAVGPAFLAAALADTALFGVLQRRHAEQRRRRAEGARAQAVVVRAVLRAGVRVGALLTYDLTVRLPGAGEVTRMVMVAPSVRLVAGEPVEVAYDPADPSNFEPAEHLQLTDRGNRS